MYRWTCILLILIIIFIPYIPKGRLCEARFGQSWYDYNDMKSLKMIRKVKVPTNFVDINVIFIKRLGRPYKVYTVG